ncbi:MAG: hypothetical protein MJ069_02555 [Salinivirgaceae bacterium]|nr:hypothetical protein [Salinivirgaceae bacterium]
MKKQILTAAIAIMAIGATAQEKVRVHNGTQSYVTEIEYITFDATEADQAISVDELQKENTQLSTEKAALVADTATLKAANTKLESFLKEKLLYDDYVDYVPILHESVDLGLSVKWATMNVGATKPEDYGNYIAWGETKTKSEYNWDTYIVEQGSFIGDNKTVLDPEDDAAAANWGGDWVMPSEADWREIYYNCTYEWTTQNGVNGYKITGTNGNSIFLPAAGCRYYGDLSGGGAIGYYWSSLDGGYSGGGRTLYFDGGFFYPWSSNSRYYGQSVRPVCPSAGNTNGHVAVDLGLPSGKLWADCNVGASTPEASGDYFAWGETEAKENYCWSTYKHMPSGKSEWYYINKYQADDHQLDGSWYKDVKYCNQGDKKTTLEVKDDVATQSWGSEWRMPTAAEWEELYDNTTQTWTNDYEGTGVKGYILTSTKEGYEGASIFLPAAGYRNYGNLDGGGSIGYYWSSSLRGDSSHCGRSLYFYEGHFNPWNYDIRYVGQSVRPVCKP